MRLATNIGMRIEDQIRLQHWIEEEGDLARNVIKKPMRKQEVEDYKEMV